MSARDGRDSQSRAGPDRRRSAGGIVRGQSALHPGRRGAGTRRAPWRNGVCRARRERQAVRRPRTEAGSKRTTGHDRRRRRSDRRDPRAQPGSRRGDAGRHRGDDRRAVASEGACRAGHACLPGARGQRVAHRACFQRSLRHRPVHDRRHPARDQSAARRAHGCGARLWLDRAWRSPARTRRGCLGRRLRGRSAARSGGPHGGL